MLPSITDVGENGGQRDNLRLIGQIEDAVDVEHVQELRRLHKTPLDLHFISLVFLKRQVQQRLPVA